MRWTKLEYGKWPEGEIVLRTKDDKGHIYYEIGEIEIWEFDMWEFNKVAYFIEKQDGVHTKLSIDSIYDLEPHYIELNDIPMPEDEDAIIINTPKGISNFHYRYFAHDELANLKERYTDEELQQIWNEAFQYFFKDNDATDDKR